MFRKAERKKAKLRLAVCGPSGSGKTFSSLLIAMGLGGRIAMIDTERGSGELYSDVAEYDVCQINAPFTPDKYIKAIRGAEQAGYDVVIIDSLSHAWAGEGGMLDMHDKATAAERNSYTAWRHVTPEHNKLIDTILQSPCHVITTLRTKTAHEMQDVNGKKVPQKVGMAPIFRDGIEYEMTVVLDLSVDKHVAKASKDRTSIFDGRNFVPDETIGAELLSWLESGKSTTLTKEQWGEVEKAASEVEVYSNLRPEFERILSEMGMDESHQEYKDVEKVFINRANVLKKAA